MTTAWQREMDDATTQMLAHTATAQQLAIQLRISARIIRQRAEKEGNQGLVNFLLARAQDADNVADQLDPRPAAL